MQKFSFWIFVTFLAVILFSYLIGRLGCNTLVLALPVTVLEVYVTIIHLRLKSTQGWKRLTLISSLISVCVWTCWIMNRKRKYIIKPTHLQLPLISMGDAYFFAQVGLRQYLQEANTIEIICLYKKCLYNAFTIPFFDNSAWSCG